MTKVNPADIGWMYHLPPKKKTSKAWHTPPLSNIPGIGNADDECFPEETGAKLPKPGCIVPRATDTDYIILAKKGGHSNLLTHRPFVAKSTDPVPYERCEWFYTSDLNLQDAIKEKGKESHVPKLPTYMVHKEFKSNKNGYATDEKCSKFGSKSRPQTSVKKKRYHVIPPYRILNYGDWRKEIISKKVPNTKIIPRYLSDNSKFLQPVPRISESEEHTEFSKLLSHAYAKDWEIKRRLWDKEFMKVSNINKTIVNKVAAKQASKYFKKFNEDEWRQNSPIGIHPFFDWEKKQTDYQERFNIKHFKPSVAIRKPPKSSLPPFPTIEEDPGDPDFWKLMSHQYAKDYVTKWKKWNDDVNTYKKASAALTKHRRSKKR